MRKRGNRIKSRPSGTMPFAALRPLPAAERTRVGLQHHEAFENVLHGRGSDRDMGIIAEALNVATALAENGIGTEGLTLFETAQHRTVETCVQSRKLGRWSVDESTKNVIADALNLHDEQLAIATLRDLKLAFAKIRNLKQAGAFINAPAVTH
jgi:hypothetical protein